MEKLKNENLKKIEIKIEGDNCIISYPSSKVHSMNEAPSFPQLENELKSTIDLNLSLSSNSDEDFISNLKEIKRKNKEYESNSKKKLEITNKSIFNSESNIKISSSDRNMKINKKIKDNKNKECTIKNSVIKKLNFDLFENLKELDKSKKLSESDRIKNKSNFLYKNKNTNLHNIYNINNIIMNNKSKNNGIKKRRNSMVNSELQINKKDNNLNKNNLNINQSFVRHRQNNSFVLSNPFNNNKIIYLNNEHIRMNDQLNYYNRGNTTLSKKSSKPEINFSKNLKKKFKSPKIYNKKRNIKNNLDKIIDEKSLIKSNCLKFKSTGNFALNKINNSSTTIKYQYKLTNEKNNSTIKKNKINKNFKTLSKNNSNLKQALNNSKKNMFCIKKPNKKIVPYLTSSITNNINPKNEKISHMNKKSEYCSLKQYYCLKTPYLLNIQPSSPTPLTSTNGCTNYTNCTNCSTLNSPSTNTSKVFYKSNKDEKNSLKAYYSQNSFLKNIVHNNLNQNNNKLIIEGKNINLNGSQKNKVKRKIIIKQNSIQTKKNYSYKKPNIKKSLKSAKNSDINKKLLNKCNTNGLKNILKSKGKCIHKILTERNINNGIHINNSFNNNIENYYDSNSNISNNNEIKDIKKVLLKNMLDLQLKQTFKNKNFFIK